MQTASFPSTSWGGDTTVYITATGSKNHRAACRYLKGSCIPISLAEAEARG